MKQDLLNLFAGGAGVAFGWMLPALMGALRQTRNDGSSAINPHEPSAKNLGVEKTSLDKG